MTKEEISEGNKMIAEFYKECIYTTIEGRKYLKCTGEKWKFPQSKEINKLYNNFPISDGNLGGLIDPDFTLLKFHSSWDWLIPIIDKITSMDAYIKYKDHSSSQFSDGGIYINTKFIDNTYNEVVEFIKWWNAR